jgi:hypothetical protein
MARHATSKAARASQKKAAVLQTPPPVESEILWPTSKPPTPPRVWRLLYLARAASVSVTAARAALLLNMVQLLSRDSDIEPQRPFTITRS